MAHIVLFHQYLTNVVGVPNNEMRDALVEQGLDSFAAFLLTTEDDIHQVCVNVRKPGGTIVNPNRTDANPLPPIPNPGLPLSFMVEKRLKMLRYYCHHMARIQRPIVPSEATSHRLSSVYDLVLTRSKKQSKNSTRTLKPHADARVSRWRTSFEPRLSPVMKGLGNPIISER